MKLVWVTVSALIAVLMAASGCVEAGGGPVTKGSRKAQASLHSTPPVSTQAVPKDLVITLERTLCYGFCPSYLLTIKADGSVTFEGREYVKQKGMVKGQLSQEQVKALLAEFERINFFSLRTRYSTAEDGCTSVETDHPSATTSILMNGKSKKVEHYYGCGGPKILEELTKFESRIDEIVNTSRWIK